MLLVRNAILMLVCLKIFVINVISVPMDVNVAHFCFSVGLGSFFFFFFFLSFFSPVLGWMVSVGRLGMNYFPGYCG